jgi:predicted enzyme related to lactoylglutathione lyase
MANATGRFNWYQLMTTEPEAASRFYTAVIGWTANAMQGPAQDYTVFEADGAGVGGMMTLPEAAKQAGAPPHWIGYIAVDSVDDAAARLTADGGTVHHAAEDIPGVGRFSVVADPQGAMFILFRPFPTGPRPAVAPGTPGHAGWHELHAAEWQSAFDFYAKQFGWTKGETHDMGPMGIYQLFATGGDAVGGMMTKQPAIPFPVWLYYFNVSDINQAAARVLQAGGKVLNGPHPVPGGSWILQCADPQGAMFALVAPPN